MSARPSTRFVAVAFVVLLATAAALGQTMAEKYPPNEDELRPTMGWAPQFQREITAPERDRVHLNVDWADNELDECPVTFGVPFPDGALSSVDHARLVTGMAQWSRHRLMRLAPGGGRMARCAGRW